MNGRKKIAMLLLPLLLALLPSISFSVDAASMPYNTECPELPSVSDLLPETNRAFLGKPAGAVLEYNLEGVIYGAHHYMSLTELMVWGIDKSLLVPIVSGYPGEVFIGNKMNYPLYKFTYENSTANYLVLEVDKKHFHKYYKIPWPSFADRGEIIFPFPCGGIRKPTISDIMLVTWHFWKVYIIITIALIGGLYGYYRRRNRA